ncbi:MAG TPA: phenylalanine--tRNA ligase subunit alpha [Blastocatellia bacterium]|nr:phenylalanine--tRNA ligase subunit alpha [Blastocatellia bacterium]
MDENLAKLRASFFAEAARIAEAAKLAQAGEPGAVAGPAEVNALRDRYLGRKSGLVAAQKKRVGTLAADQRAEFGRDVNEVSTEVEAELARIEELFRTQAAAQALQREVIDVTLPGTRPRRGRLHPITLIKQKLEDVFVSMGYSIEDGPEIETAFYNFDALNIPLGHPARDRVNTFYITEELALRSQTSTVQIHTMQRSKPPLRIVAPGRVFRRDTPDPTHNPMFFQIEGLNVSHNITMADLKGTLQRFVELMFGPQLKTRFRPSYFPFTEPSAEVDFSCFVCGGIGCRICKGSGWIELGGSGMVHPNVLEGVGIDPDEFSGFAFGLGIDRMAALMYGIDDIRLLYENDVRFLEQFH